MDSSSYVSGPSIHGVPCRRVNAHRTTDCPTRDYCIAHVVVHGQIFEVLPPSARLIFSHQDHGKISCRRPPYSFAGKPPAVGHIDTATALQRHPDLHIDASTRLNTPLPPHLHYGHFHNHRRTRTHPDGYPRSPSSSFTGSRVRSQKESLRANC
jgi:hypothetical protein